MLQMICSCGELMGNKQIIYEEQMKKVCDKAGYDFNAISLGVLDKNKEFVEMRQEIINNCCRRYCCKINLMNFVDIVYLIKG
jgi:hypothetical protein